jgi:hypothetical protein
MAHEELHIDTLEDEVLADPAGIDNVALLRRIKSWWRSDAEHRSKWEKQADMDFGFVACDQWSDDDKKKMEDAGRVPVVFNRCLTMIKSIAGSEINGRLETRFKPRGVEDTKVNELLSSASEWMGDQCDAEDEQSEAFEAALICGMGWTETRFSFDENPQGMYEEGEIDPREMFWDCKARKKNLVDARRISRLRSISISDAKAMFPKIKNESDLDASWAQHTTDGSNKDVRSVEDKVHREEMDDAVAADKNDVRILQIQWWEKEPFWLVAMEQSPEQMMQASMAPQLGQPAPVPPEPEELSDEEFKEFKKRAKEMGIQFQAAKMERRRYKQAFVGDKILEIGECPCPYEFSFHCITGERDRKNNHFFGIVRLMRDPQMWANKMLANTLHIANTTAKGGIIAEKNAFDDERQAEESYAQPNEISWAAEGAVKDGRIMAKPGGGDPSVYIKILEFAIASIRDVTGVNMELLGLRDANQPGVLEAQRKQAAMTVLASLFNSLRRFRKSVGRVRLHIIQEHLSDGRLIRIKGGDGKVEPLDRERTLGEYDVIVEDAPTSPNQKEQTWLMINQILPTFKDMLTPEVVLALLDYSPFPTDVVEKLKELKAKSDQAQAPVQQQTQQMQMQLMQEQIKNLQSDTAKNMAAAQKTGAEGQVVGANVQAENMKGMAEAQAIMIDAQNKRVEGEGKAAKAQADAEGSRLKARSDYHVTMQKAAGDQELTAAKVEQIIAQTQKTTMETMMAAMDQKFEQMLALRGQQQDEQLSYGEQALRKSESEGKLAIQKKAAAAKAAAPAKP